MTHKEYLEMLIGPLAGEGGGGGGITPSGSVTLTENTDSNGVDVTTKAKAVVNVQGGADSNYVYPSIPSGYREIHTVSLKKSVVQGYTAGQINKQISVPLPMWMNLQNGDKIAITGYAQETGEPFVIAGTVVRTYSYSTYQYPTLNIDYNGYVGSEPVIPSGYTEVKAGCPFDRSTVLGCTLGLTNKSLGQVSIAETIAVGDKVCVTGITKDTGEMYTISGTVSAVQQYTTYQYPKVTVDVAGAVSLAPGLYIGTNPETDIDVKGREFVKMTEELIKPQGTFAISQNGSSIDIARYRYVDVNVQAPPSGGSEVVDFEGVREIGEYGIHAESNNPNTTIVMLRFPNLEMLNAGNFGSFTALTDVYFGPSFASIKGTSFDLCDDLASVYFDAWAGGLPFITNGYAPGQSTQCIYYMPNSLISMAQWDPNWSSLYQMNRLVDLDQAPYSPVVLYRPGQKCVYHGYQWENGSSGQPGVPGVDPAWQQIGPA